MDSILGSIKKMLGISEEYTAFDQDLILCINSVFSVLTQMGIGPKNGFSISDSSAVWTDFIPDMSLVEMLKSYMHLRVRALFDPPNNSFLLENMKENAKELEWRLYVQCDDSKWETEEDKKKDEK